MVVTSSDAANGLPVPLGLDLLDFIAADDRPTFILQRPHLSLGELPTNDHSEIRVAFQNESFQRLFTNKDTAATFDFQKWTQRIPHCLISGPPGVNGLSRVQELFAERSWSAKTINGGFLAVFCSQETGGTARHYALQHEIYNRQSERDRDAVHNHHTAGLVESYTSADGYDTSQSEDSVEDSVEDSGHRLQRTMVSETSQVADEQDLEDIFIDFLENPDAITDPWIRSFVGYDWASTALGHISRWPTTLRSAVVSMLFCPAPRCMYWGNDLLILYNEAGQVIPGTFHPAFGKSAVELFGQATNDVLKSTARTALDRGKSDWLPEAAFIMATEGYVRERWFKYYTLPIPSAEGRFCGFLIELEEITTLVLQRNRADSLASTAKAIASAGSLTDLWTRIPTAIGNCGSKDIAYAMLYALDGTGRVSSDSPADSKGTQIPRFVASHGLPDTAHMDDVPHMLAREFALSAKTDELLLWQTTTNSLPQSLALEFEHGTTGDVCVVTITNAWQRGLAYLVIGIDPVRPCDADSQSFLLELRDLFSRAAAFRDFSEPHQIERKPDLHLDAPVGLVKFAPDGSILYANDSYFELFSTPRCDNIKSIWADAIFPEDLGLCRSSLAALAAGKGGNWSARLNAPARAPHTGQRWIENVGVPEFNSRGEVTIITGWIVDITDRKSLEILLAQRLEDAVEVKKAAERFTDTLSHELRNPLSAILQSADGILSAIARRTFAIRDEGHDEIVESAKTIMLCAQHQKDIVDDVLTLSKLDSDLVILTPEAVAPWHLLQKAQTMFDAQLKSNNIKSITRIDESVAELRIDHVLMDSRRVLQIIINLLSNAIKFVSLSETREIGLELSASKLPPIQANTGASFLAPRLRTSVTDTADRPTNMFASSHPGEQVYLQFSVRDTGPGMSEQEMRKLFQRFAQASPKTYKQYGGTGLGLFISRELAELHGGQIGLLSAPGLGSTFTFYIQAQRVDVPPEVPDARVNKPSNKPTGNGIAKTISIGEVSILLVEDNAINQRVMSRQLKAAGCKRVHVADHGLDALNFLTTTSRMRGANSTISVNVLLLDVEMPIMDGLTAARRIREMESSGELIGHVPIIGITANARKEQIDSAIEAGMDAVVTKPFLVPDLVPRIKALIEYWSTETN